MRLVRVVPENFIPIPEDVAFDGEAMKMEIRKRIRFIEDHADVVEGDDSLSIRAADAMDEANRSHSNLPSILVELGEVCNEIEARQRGVLYAAGQD